MNTNRPALALLAALVVPGGVWGGILQTLGAYTPLGVDGHNVVGYRGADAFIYNDITQTLTTFRYPGNLATGASDISGSTVLGGYYDSSGNRNGFLYSLSTGTFTSFMHPLAGSGTQKGTLPADIDGDNVVGNYVDAAGKQHGFLYNLASQTWTTLDYPAANLGEMTINGISGNYLVGYYKAGTNPHFSFLYDLATSS